jgi:hypothetical protein
MVVCDQSFDHRIEGLDQGLASMLALIAKMNLVSLE